MTRYEWDQRKARENLRKHGVDFADAVGALEDEFALTVHDLHAQGEERYVTMGADPLDRILVVVFTWRGDRIRVISARQATGRERRQYEEGQ
ncbi:MAG TPA: BrnT family toxin [Thermoanaerobaculia bacterium]|nr:BrnT family toxin [Thermoanaerobaculia bacterium]